MFRRGMHYGRWGYGRRFFRGPRLFWRRGCFPGCGCLLPLLLIGALAVLFLAHIL